MISTDKYPIIEPNFELAKTQNIRSAKFGMQMKLKFDKNIGLAAQIEEYFHQQGINLPYTKKDLMANIPFIFDHQNYGSDLEDELLELARTYYDLKTGKGYYAEFENNKEKKIIATAFQYSKNRVDFAWNMRKSQIVRSRYFSWLCTNLEGKDAILRKLLPIHLVLTLPHKDGYFKGKKFYARELVQLFATLRKQRQFKKMVYGGEYGLEIKRSEKNGLHIHIHSFILQKPEYTINQVRTYIETEWEKLTENKSGYSGIHYENLYNWRKDEKGKLFIRAKRDKEGNMVLGPVKDYINPKICEPVDYIKGVLECIKYHFKPNCLDMVDGGYDIDLIRIILNNTKGLRMYSRFGQLLKTPELNFNALQTTDSEIIADNEENSDNQNNDEVSADVSRVESKMLNPLTGLPAKRDDYRILIAKPTAIFYKSNDSDVPHEPHSYDYEAVAYCPSCLDLKQIIALDMQGKLKPMLFYDLDEYKKFDFAEKHFFEIMQEPCALNWDIFNQLFSN